MIQVNERELAIVVELANRAPKSSGETYALQLIVAKWNASQQEQEQQQKREKER